MRKIEMDMTSGPLLKKIIIYSIPLILTNILQFLFKAADILVLGIFVDDNAVAAVGANGSLIDLLTNFFIGLSVGSNVLVARHLGKNDQESTRKFIGMSIFVAVVSGTMLLGVGVLFGRTFLVWTGISEESPILDMAVKYLTIYFLGMPIIMLYNFASAIMRAAGDTFRPMLFLMIGGIINIGLNIFFVLVLHADVEGVAIATVASQGFSAAACLIVLLKSNGIVKFKFRYFRIYGKEFLELVKIGVPSGIQSCLFALSNVLIQSSVNSLGDKATAGFSYECQIANIVYIAQNSVALACMSFVGQNLGAKKPDRIRRSVIISMAYASSIGIVLGTIATFIGPTLIGFITQDEEVLYYLQQILYYVTLPYFLCAILDVVSYSMRSLGKSFTTMIICLFGACVFRIIWLETVFKKVRTAASIFISYPISWIATSAVIAIFLIREIKKLEKNIDTYGESVFRPFKKVK